MLDPGVPAASFDAVVCVFGIFFVPDMPAAIRALVRCAKPGGTIAVTTWGPRLFEPMNTVFWNAVRAVRPDLDRSFNPWDRISDPAAVRALFADAGVDRIAARCRGRQSSTSIRGRLVGAGDGQRLPRHAREDERGRPSRCETGHRRIFHRRAPSGPSKPTWCMAPPDAPSDAKAPAPRSLKGRAARVRKNLRHALALAWSASPVSLVQYSVLGMINSAMPPIAVYLGARLVNLHRRCARAVAAVPRHVAGHPRPLAGDRYPTGDRRLHGIRPEPVRAPGAARSGAPAARAGVESRYRPLRPFGLARSARARQAGRLLAARRSHLVRPRPVGEHRDDRADGGASGEPSLHPRPARHRRRDPVADSGASRHRAALRVFLQGDARGARA